MAKATGVTAAELASSSNRKGQGQTFYNPKGVRGYVEQAA